MTSGTNLKKPMDWGTKNKMKYLPIDTDLFVQNSKRFVEQLQPNSIAVFNSNDIMPTSADGIHPFIQQTDLFYLSGIDQEESILVICPDAKEEKHREILFLRETNEQIALWEGQKYTKDEATAVSGIKTVCGSIFSSDAANTSSDWAPCPINTSLA